MIILSQNNQYNRLLYITIWHVISFFHKIENAIYDPKDDDGQVCLLINTKADINKPLTETQLRYFEKYLFDNQTLLCKDELDYLIPVMRREHRSVRGSRLLPKNQDIMDDFIWVDDMDKKHSKCRALDLYDRARIVASLSAKAPNLARNLIGARVLQNMICEQNLKTEVSNVLEGEYEMDEQLKRRSPEERKKILEAQTNQMVPENRRVINFLRYNLECILAEDFRGEKKIPQVFESLSDDDVYNRGIATFIYSRARRFEQASKSNNKANLDDLKMDYYERELYRLVTDACEEVRDKLNRFKYQFDSIRIFSIEPEVHYKLAEVVANIQICDLISTRRYGFKGVYNELLKLWDKEREEAEIRYYQLKLERKGLSKYM